MILISRFLEPVFLGSTAANNQIVDTVLFNFLNTKIEHLVSFINLLNGFNGNFPNSNKFFVFKLFKSLTFFLLYILLDEEIMVNKNVIKNLHFNKHNVITFVKKFFEKSRLDRYMIEKIPENYRNKFNKFLKELEKKHVLNKISEVFPQYLEDKENDENMKFEEECENLNTYFDNNITKYFKRIENYYYFLTELKDERINIIYEEATYISDVDMEQSPIKEKIIPSSVKRQRSSSKTRSKRKSRAEKSPDAKDKRKKGSFKF